MSGLSLFTLAQAAFFGVLHALKPCAHSWPMLLPFLGTGRRVFAVALPFAIGAFIASGVIGFGIGAMLGQLPGEWLHRMERVIGGVIFLIGIALFLRPRFGHIGHVHGDCEPGHEPHCAHSTHNPRRFMKTGQTIGLVLLGAFNMSVPCVTTLVGFSLAATGGSAAASTVILGTFGVATGITIVLLLSVLARGLQLLQRLSGGKAEMVLIRTSAVFLIVLGLILAFHWHSHD